MGLFFSKVLWRRQITTIPDLFRERFSVNTERLAALIMIPSSIVWAGAQIRAFGQIIHSTTEMGYTIAVIVAAATVIIYTISGGLLADAYTDFIQGIALIIGLLFITFALVMDLGGIGPALKSIPLEKLTFKGGDGAKVSWLGNLELWMVPILGSLMAQELVTRVSASRSEKVAFHSSIRAGIMYFVIGCIPVLVGLLGTNFFPDLKDSETLMPLLAKTHMSYFFYVIFLGALVSAILSTVDTTLLSASALAGHNLIFPHLKNISEKKKVLIARLLTFSAGLVSFVIAFLSDSITALVQTASSLGGPSILVMTVVALWVKKGDAKNALFAMGMSLVTWVIANFILKIEFPIIATVATCAVSYFLSLMIFDVNVPDTVVSGTE
jgi:Na+/proline symporter